ncbi:FCGR2 protein, partial [Hirundo rustica]|nr:FCGR2 protein [Hirundo rustica]
TGPPPCPPDWLVLQVPVWPLLEGDTATLRCRGSGDKSVTGVTFYHGDEEVRRMSLRGTEQSLSLSPLQLHHRGRYRCGGSVSSWGLQKWKESQPVTVTVRGEHPTAPQ